MIGLLLTALLLGGPIEVRSIRRDTPVITDTSLYSDWAYIYRIDLPVAGVYDLSLVCGPDEYATVKGLVGPRMFEVKVTTVLRNQPSCYISSYERRALPSDGGTDGGPDAGS